MAKLSLTLHGENGFKKTITEDYVSGQKFLDYLKLMDELGKNKKLSVPEFLIKKIQFVASLFTATPVTPEEIIQGVNSWELVKVIDELIDTAMGAKGEDPKQEGSLLEKLERGS